MMGTFIIREEDTLEKHNLCCILDTIDEGMAEYVIRFLLEKEYGESKPDHVKLLINTGGGNVTDSYAIIDVMNLVSYPIHTIGLGKVWSAGLDILVNGTPGHRYLMRNTSVMSHQTAIGIEGKFHEIKALEKENEMLTQRVVEHYMRTTGLTEDQINQELMPASDVYLSPEEAIQLGLADKILERF